jgi:hypothetical protein
LNYSKEKDFKDQITLNLIISGHNFHCSSQLLSDHNCQQVIITNRSQLPTGLDSHQDTITNRLQLPTGHNYQQVTIIKKSVISVAVVNFENP